MTDQIPTEPDPQQPRVIQFLYAIGGVIAAVAAVIGAVATLMASCGSDPPTPPSSTGSTHTLTSDSTPPSPSGPLMVSVTCAISASQARPGETVRLTYTIISNQAGLVGLGAAIYDDAGKDHSTGSGDRDDFEVRAGRVSASRDVPIPADLGGGRYELAAEVWRAGHIGDGETLADDGCGYLTVS